METLDHFNGNAFSSTSLTESLRLAPYNPRLIEATGLFTFQGVRTRTIELEYKEGQVSLLTTKTRGQEGDGVTRTNRNIRNFSIPHIPHKSTIMAEQIQGVRKFGGQASELESIAEVINEELEQHKEDHATTLEFHRMGAINGISLDADGSELYNIFTEFGIAQDAYTFDFGASEGALQYKCTQITDAMQRSLGGTVYTGVNALVDDVFFKNLIESPSVRDAWIRHQDQRRTQGFGLDAQLFSWGGINWARYSVAVGDRPFIGGTNVARFYPTGVNKLFRWYGAPAPWMEAVNTVGLEMYAKQVRLKLDAGVEIHTHTNPLMICTRPAALKKATSVAAT